MGDDHSERVALVSGGSSGIGRASAALLREMGFTVFATSRTPGATPDEELLEMDVRSTGSVARAVAVVLERTGRVDLLVNNAGYALVGEAEATSEDEVRDQLDTNLLGVMRLTNAVLPSMRARGGGRIVNVSSLTGLVGVPFMSAYAASKFALEGYSESVRLEVASFGVGVSLVEPGFVNTPFGAHAAVARTRIEAYDSARSGALGVITERLAAGIPPEEVARAIVTAATAPRPRLRYRVGKDSVRLPRLRAIVPASRFEAGARKMFRLDS
jgi:NAD(P)-dependent dehydrogenase (short-subunit alcohol dehydrogenase family)